MIKKILFFLLSILLTSFLVGAQTTIVNLMWLNKIVNENVIKALDHKQIDTDIDWFKGKSPSTENLVKFIWDKLNPFFIDSNSILHKIYLRETSTIYTEYYGPNKEGQN